MTMVGGMQGYTTGGGNDKLHDRIEQLEAKVTGYQVAYALAEQEIERLKATERFLRSERPMARKLTELEKQRDELVDAIETVLNGDFSHNDLSFEDDSILRAALASVKAGYP